MAGIGVKNTFSEDQQKTFVSIKNKLEPQEQKEGRKEGRKEARKEGRQTVAPTSEGPKIFLRKEDLFWIELDTSEVGRDFFFQKKLGQCKIGPFHVSRWWQL